MPNTKSAERRMRSTARRQLHNRTVKSRIKTLERKYLETLQTGKKDDATVAYRSMTSALDKAAKVGIIHWSKADRKKSRLGLRLAALR